MAIVGVDQFPQLPDRDWFYFVQFTAEGEQRGGEGGIIVLLVGGVEWVGGVGFEEVEQLDCLEGGLVGEFECFCGAVDECYRLIFE